jgi:hypothetical protein
MLADSLRRFAVVEKELKVRRCLYFGTVLVVLFH